MVGGHDMHEYGADIFDFVSVRILTADNMKTKPGLLVTLKRKCDGRTVQLISHSATIEVLVEMKPEDLGKLAEQSL